MDVNTRDRQHWTALHAAVDGLHLDVVLDILNHTEVNPNLPDYRGLTPLHLAVINGSWALTHALLRRPDVNPNTIGDVLWLPKYWLATRHRFPHRIAPPPVSRYCTCACFNYYY